MRLVRIKEAPAQPGKAIQAKWTTRRERAKLRALIVKAKKQGDLRTWRRGKAVRVLRRMPRGSEIGCSLHGGWQEVTRRS